MEFYGAIIWLRNTYSNQRVIVVRKLTLLRETIIIISRISIFNSVW